MGEQGHQGEEAEQSGSRAADRAVGPLALGLDAEVGADFAEGHFERPAQDEPGDDLERSGGEVRTEQGLGGKRPARIADEHPADGEGWQARVVPDGGVREELDGPVVCPLPASDRGQGPGGRGVFGRGSQRGPTRPNEAWAPGLLRPSWWSGHAQVCLQA